jgi:hypothetical protein
MKDLIIYIVASIIALYLAISSLVLAVKIVRLFHSLGIKNINERETIIGYGSTKSLFYIKSLCITSATTGFLTLGIFIYQIVNILIVKI